MPVEPAPERVLSPGEKLRLDLMGRAAVKVGTRLGNSDMMRHGRRMLREAQAGRKERPTSS